MGLRSALQEIIGEKIFRHNIIFDKDVIFKKHITAYTPVASEPSWGTPHTRLATLVNGVDPPNTNDVIVTANVPPGAKGIYGIYRLWAISAGNDRVVVIKDMAGNAWEESSGFQGGYNVRGNFIVSLDSNKQFKYCVWHADVSELYIYQRKYYF